MSQIRAGEYLGKAELDEHKTVIRRNVQVREATPEIITTLAKQVSSGATGPYLLVSPETYLIESAVRAISTAWFGKSPDPLQVIQVHSKEFSSDYFLSNVLTFGMFAERRLALLRDIDLLGSEGLSTVTESVAQIPPETLLICTLKAKKATKNKLTKSLAQLGKVIELPVLRGMDLIKWVRQAARAEKLSLHPQVEAELIATFGGDLYQLSSELDKLATFRGSLGGEISMDDLRSVMGRSSLHTIFDLTDALGEHNLVKARRELRQLLSAGENPAYIITMLEWHLANLWQCKSAPSADPQTIARALSIHPYVATKCLKQAANFSLKTLENSYLLAVDCEFRLKTGKAPRLDVELDRLIVESIANA